MSKKELLLQSVIAEYLRVKEPIGSSSLQSVIHARSKISSATIRNYFKILSDEGLLFQPHISSGRIPTLRALRAHWHQVLDTKNPLFISDLSKIESASSKMQIFCMLSLEKSNRLCEVESFERGGKKQLLVVFENLGLVLEHSQAIERFLQELKGLELADVRKIAFSVRANALLSALEGVESRQLVRYYLPALLEAFSDAALPYGDVAQSAFGKERRDEIFYEIAQGRIFDRLENGIYCQELLREGYMAIMQDVLIGQAQSQRARMLCLGALSSDFGSLCELLS